MRYLTVLAHPSGSGGFHPLGRALTAEPSVQREAIHHVELLADGTVLLLAEGSGNRARYEEIMADSAYVVDYLTSGDERWMAVSQFEPTDVARRVLELRRESDLVIETPIRFTADGSLRITYLGTDGAFRDLYEQVVRADDVSFEVVETGDYEPGNASLLGMLTQRQQDVLETAVELGYYSAPREATLEDVAAAVGIAATTAGDHLRKVEARIFGSLVR